MKTIIFIERIERETEKAILVVANVSYNANKPKERSFWFPKSVIEKAPDAHVLKVEGWFLNKLSEQNAFHGYRMNFQD